MGSDYEEVNEERLVMYLDQQRSRYRLYVLTIVCVRLAIVAALFFSFYFLLRASGTPPNEADVIQTVFLFIFGFYAMAELGGLWATQLIFNMSESKRQTN